MDVMNVYASQGTDLKDDYSPLCCVTLTSAGSRCTNAVDTTVSQFCQYHALQQAKTLRKAPTLAGRGGGGSSSSSGSLLGPRSQAAAAAMQSGGAGQHTAGRSSSS